LITMAIMSAMEASTTLSASVETGGESMMTQS
jgi:hypothetical protein